MVPIADLDKLYQEILKANQRDEDATALVSEYKALVDSLKPNFIGPTWQRDKDGFILPERTLGWQILEWAYEYLRSPRDGGILTLTKEQARFILWWYAVDENGKFAYRGGVLQRLKGWGKDPTAAILACIEFVGPSQFSHFDETGQPVGKPHPAAWVQIAAVSFDQTKNTSTVFPAIISQHMVDDYGIKMTEASNIIRAEWGRKRIEMVTSSPRTLEGGRPTFVIMNEPHHWLQGNGGLDMYQVIRRNTTKVGGRWLGITNAFLPGEESAAEKMRRSYDEVQAGIARDAQILWDSIEAHPDTPLTPEALQVALPKIRGDAWWFPVEDTIKEIQDTSISVSQHRRFYLNQVVAGEDRLHSPKTWDPLQRPGETLKPGDEIVLGFDGGKSDDATVLIALRVNDMFAQPLGIWQKPDHYTEGKWEVDRQAVDSAVHGAFKTYKVRGFYADVNLWESFLYDWQQAYGDRVAVKAQEHKPFEWDMRGSGRKVTMAHEALMTSIFDRKLRHAGESNELSRLLRMHVLNAVRHETIHGLSFRKESRESPRKVDAYAGLLLAHQCLVDYRQRGKVEKQRSGQVFFY